MAVDVTRIDEVKLEFKRGARVVASLPKWMRDIERASMGEVVNINLTKDAWRDVLETRFHKAMDVLKRDHPDRSSTHAKVAGMVCVQEVQELFREALEPMSIAALSAISEFMTRIRNGELS